jgi:hypothetical protein
MTVKTTAAIIGKTCALAYDEWAAKQYRRARLCAPVD